MKSLASRGKTFALAFGAAVLQAGLLHAAGVPPLAVPGSVAAVPKTNVSAPVAGTPGAGPVVATTVLGLQGPKVVPTESLLYTGDYRPMPTITASALVYNGDYAPIASVGTGVLLYIGASPSDAVGLPAFMTPKQIPTAVLTYQGDYAPLPNQLVPGLVYTGAYPPMLLGPVGANRN